MDYKPTYTKQEVDEIITWFDTHKYEQDVDLGKGIHIRKLNTTLQQLKYIASTRYNSHIFSGQIYILFRIREELIKQGKVIGE